MSVIYEKHYPHPSFGEKMKELEKYKQEMEDSPDYEPEPMLSFEEFYNNMMKNRTLILLPLYDWQTAYLSLRAETVLRLQYPLTITLMWLCIKNSLFIRKTFRSFHKDILPLF